MSIFPEPQIELAIELLDQCRDKSITITTAESCTGGLIAGCITSISGSSDVVERGFVTYTNQAKSEMLGVSESLFYTVGAVSEEVAKSMAEGALTHSSAGLSVSVTGITGPGGSTPTKPVGLVYIAVCEKSKKPTSQKFIFEGNRDQVREQAVTSALTMMLSEIA